MPPNELEETLASDEPEDAPLGQGEFSIPAWLRCIAVIVFLVVLAISVILFAMYLSNPVKGLQPDELGLPSLIVFSTLAIIVFLIPWGDYGLRIKKFGPFEFEEILSMQAKEHTEELVALRERIQLLENQRLSTESEANNKASAEGAQAELEKPDRLQELRKRLVDFLTEYDRYAFSPTRIRYWGSQQANFTDLRSFEVDEIRRTLQSMVASGDLETRVSKKGNTLYRVPR